MTSKTFPERGRRVIFYLIYDAHGNVEDYIPYKLDQLRPFAETIVAVVNGSLTPSSRTRLERSVDEILERDNTGFDVGGYRDALAWFGEDRLSEYDELILMNYTFFGPVRPFGPLFARMDATPAEFWGVTDHGPVEPTPYPGVKRLPAHIQSHWIAVRKPMFQSDDWREYWRDMPPIRSYADSIVHHESRFTEWFESRGHHHEVAYPYQNYAPSIHPAFLNAKRLIEEGCPVLKRRPFFHDPLYLDREGIVGRWLVDTATATGYPEDFIWQSMARSAEPRVLYTNASLMEILPTEGSRLDASALPTIAVVMHVFYEDMADEMLDRVRMLPGTVDVYVTTDTETKAQRLREAITRRTELSIGRSEVRVVESNRGRDQSAFWVTCHDVLHDERYELIVKLHSKRSVQDGEGPGELFRREQFENLFATPDYVANLVGLFQRHRYLGAVYPPMIHMGYPTMGNAWFTNLRPARRLAKELGIRVPIGDASPLAPYGGMFVARRVALRSMADAHWTFDDYPPEGDYGDGALSHVQERLVSYAVAEAGYHSRTVATAEYAAISHTFLEYKLDQMSARIPGWAVDQVGLVNRIRSVITSTNPLSVGKYYLGWYLPGLTTRLIAARDRMRERREA